ncbi:hypothetical protein [Acetobacter indonesiensis]|nr:hypothetical protein [Acetobacter indonesiensis]MCP1229672.1 hypothetical protein [Acetobacter indonesiensis]
MCHTNARSGGTLQWGMCNQPVFGRLSHWPKATKAIQALTDVPNSGYGS